MLESLAIVALVAACSGESDDPSSTGDMNPAQGANAGQVSDSCQPPDILFMLDRTLSMAVPTDASYPDAHDPNVRQLQTKWGIANQAVKDLTQRLATTIRPGLGLFPRNPGPDAQGERCVPLETQMVNRYNRDHNMPPLSPARNTACEAGEILVNPDAQAAAAIQTAIGTDSTLLCASTPIGAGLQSAETALAGIAAPGRPQYVVLLTDGADTCEEEGVDPAEAPSTQRVQALAAAGIKTYVISFSGAVRPARLNQLACAGRTATDLDTNCHKDSAGNYSANETDAQLYLVAENKDSLESALRSIAGQVCCDCASLI